MNTIAISIKWGMSPPTTTRAAIPHPISRSPSTRWTHRRVPNPQPSHKDRAHVTGYRDIGPSIGHAATLHITSNSVACSHQWMIIFLTRQSHLCKIKNVYKFHCSFSNTEHAEVGTGSRRLLWCHQLVVMEHPSWLRHTLMDVASV